jgi:hypothetical protein
MGVKEMVDYAVKADYIISNPIEHYSIDEIKKLSEMAKQNDLLLSIKEERSNFYQGIMINLIKKSILKETNIFISAL